MNLQSFLSELPFIGSDTPASGPPKLAAGPSSAATSEDVTHTQHFRVRVPSPQTDLRMGKTSGEKGLDGFRLSTVEHSSFFAGRNVYTVAGEADAYKGYTFAKDESGGQGTAQTVVAGALDLMKMVVAPTGVGLLVGAASIGYGISKVVMDKKSYGNLSLTAKSSFSAISAGTAQISAVQSTTVWGGLVAKYGAGGSVSVQGGVIATLASGKTSCVVSAFQSEVVSGWETEIASRWGETVIRGKEIQIGVPSDSFLLKHQRRTEEVEIHADDEIKLTSGGKHPGPKDYEALLLMKEGDVDLDAQKVSVRAEDKASFHVGSSTVVLEPKELQLSVDGPSGVSAQATKANLSTYLGALATSRRTREAAVAAASSPMVPHAAAMAARVAANAAYDSAKLAATVAMEQANKAARISSPTLHLSTTAAKLTTSPTNGLEISRLGGIELTCGAGQITMSSAGIVLKFGPSKIILGPAGVVIDAGPGLITQKASIVNSP